MMNFAEVIGDPIVQSKSPIIHRHWLDRLGIEADYFKTLVPPDGLAQFLGRRAADPTWLGCNVTIPHKQRIIPLLAELDAGAAAIGAVNCVVPRKKHLIGFNTDIDGIAAALDSIRLEDHKVAVIGAGGGARALIAYLKRRKAGFVSVLVRDPGKACIFRDLAAGIDLAVLPLDRVDEAFEGAAAIINASPLGMAGAAEMPHELLDAAGRNPSSATIFDMVTTPAETPLLRIGRANGTRVVDGLTMLVGQARRAFQLFFGREPPGPDARLRDLLVT